MAIPNTTPTPNELYNGEMKKMKDVELRVVLVVTRATLGWEVDHESGMRKQEDWLTRGQIKEKTGRGIRSISRAIKVCVENGWIEARDEYGNLLKDPASRKELGGKILYRLGEIFLGKIQPVPKVPTTSANLAQGGVPKVPTTKESTTKETLTKDISTEIQNPTGKSTNDVIEMFKDLNPLYRQFFPNKNQRKAVERMLKTIGSEKIKWALKAARWANGMTYGPSITTPIQLEQKLGQLIAFVQKEKKRSEDKKAIII